MTKVTHSAVSYESGKHIDVIGTGAYYVVLAGLESKDTRLGWYTTMTLTVCPFRPLVLCISQLWVPVTKHLM